MRDEALASVMQALMRDGGDARYVGGAVRNALMGKPVKDIDIATPLPDDVVRQLEHAGIGAVPTGIAHGTVTVLVDGKSFEVTTLREDIETDGRHAVVRFGADFARCGTPRLHGQCALDGSPRPAL